MKEHTKMHYTIIKRRETWNLTQLSNVWEKFLFAQQFIFYFVIIDYITIQSRILVRSQSKAILTVLKFTENHQNSFYSSVRLSGTNYPSSCDQPRPWAVRIGLQKVHQNYSKNTSTTNSCKLVPWSTYGPHCFQRTSPCQNLLQSDPKRLSNKHSEVYSLSRK